MNRAHGTHFVRQHFSFCVGEITQKCCFHYVALWRNWEDNSRSFMIALVVLKLSINLYYYVISLILI